MDDKQTDQPQNPPTVTGTNEAATPVDPEEQEELNEVKNLEKEEQEEVQTDAAEIDKREMEGKELEEEAKNLPADKINKPQQS